MPSIFWVEVVDGVMGYGDFWGSRGLTTGKRLLVAGCWLLVEDRQRQRPIRRFWLRQNDELKQARARANTEILPFGKLRAE
jgi:hypothetical protein